MPFKEIRQKLEKSLQERANQIGLLIETQAPQKDLDQEFAKFKRLKNMVEECYLKEKLVFKRALVLCRSLLKFCHRTTAEEHDICSLLISPAIESRDADLTILALECLGLITILQADTFEAYS